MASRIASKAKPSRWLSDPATYPLIFCISVGSALCLSVGVRHLTSSPDVKWNRKVRMNPELAIKDQNDWMSHREGLKNLVENPVNRSKK
ncbi:TPA: hypothetical protein N0F65_001693 [Lagenidium giganteum]|uniref:Uncharacterized protein n=1 Tax=Lagenidium giganteum TaxID=4803 RepID=A0AAV2YNP6_9STRA|nr:TPA: hypothetical protein N0F65_001693 [Lagenidium giganteum]